MRLKYYDGVIGGYDGFTILMREERSLYHYSKTPEFTQIDYRSCELKKGDYLETCCGIIEVDEVVQDEKDINVTFKYYDYNQGTKKAMVSLGQEIVFNLLEDGDNPCKYNVSKCHLMITTKQYAKEKIENFYNEDPIKHFIKKKK